MGIFYISISVNHATRQEEEKKCVRGGGPRNPGCGALLIRISHGPGPVESELREGDGEVSSVLEARVTLPGQGRSARPTKQENFCIIFFSELSDLVMG